MDKEGFDISIYCHRGHQNCIRASQPSTKAEAGSLGWAFRLLEKRLLDDLFVSRLQACRAGRARAQVSWRHGWVLSWVCSYFTDG